MAVTQPGASVTNQGNSGGFTQSVTLDSTCNIVVAQLITYFDPGAFSAATFAGSAMTNLFTAQHAGTSTIYHSWYYLVNPTVSSAQNCILTWANFRAAQWCIIGFAGADTTTPWRVQTGPANFLANGVNPGTTPTNTLAGVSGDLAIDSCGFNATADVSLTVGSGQTNMLGSTLQATPNALRAATSREALSSASVVMDWTFGGAKTGVAAAAVIAQSAATAATPLGTMMGVGT